MFAPFWPAYHRLPQHDPEPVPERKDSRASLAAEMNAAVKAGDLEKARNIMDRSFWARLDYRPDWYPLCLALDRQDRSMTKFLLGHGARLTEGQASILFLSMGEKMEGMRSLLSFHGIKFPGERDLSAFMFDKMAAVEISTRFARESSLTQGAAGPFAVQAAQTVALVFISYMQGQKWDEAATVLKLAGQNADGKGEYDISDALDVALVQTPFNPELAVSVLNNALLHLPGGRVRSPALKGLSLAYNPALVGELKRRGKLGDETRKTRMEVVEGWVKAFRDGWLHETAAQRAYLDFREAAFVLFGEARPLSAEEADRFVRLHEETAKVAPDLLKGIEKDLHDAGFFKSPHWTPDRLEVLAGPGEKNGLSGAFYRTALHLRIREMGFPNLLSWEKLPLLFDLQKFSGGLDDEYKNAKILDLLSSELEKGRDKKEVVAALADMKASGFSFPGIDPARYLGRKEPGLAKMLLDLDIVEACEFDLEKLQEKVGGKKIVIGVYPDHKHYAYAEFIARVLLEGADRKKFAPFRQKSGVSWQSTMVREVMLSREKLNFTYRPRRQEKADGKKTGSKTQKKPARKI